MRGKVRERSKIVSDFEKRRSLGLQYFSVSPHVDLNSTPFGTSLALADLARKKQDKDINLTRIFYELKNTN